MYRPTALVRDLWHHLIIERSGMLFALYTAKTALSNTINQ